MIGVEGQGDVFSTLALGLIHIGVGKAKVVADFMKQHMADDMAQNLPGVS